MYSCRAGSGAGAGFLGGNAGQAWGLVTTGQEQGGPQPVLAMKPVESFIKKY